MVVALLLLYFICFTIILRSMTAAHAILLSLAGRDVSLFRALPCCRTILHVVLCLPSPVSLTQVSVNREVLVGRPFSECVKFIRDASSSEQQETRGFQSSLVILRNCA